jgi:branched-chain amino acid transport system substrate-binding protein
MMNKKIFLAVGIFIFLFFLIWNPVGNAQEKIQIGAVFPQTGPLAFSGMRALQGATAAKDLINKRGGVLGRQVEFIVTDAPDSTTAANEAERLITFNKVKVLVGSFSSSISMAASPVANRHGAIYWETGAAADDVTGRGLKYVFRTITRISNQGNTGAEYAVNVLAAKCGLAKQNLVVGTMYEDGPFGVGMGTAAAKRVEELGAKLAFNESYTAAKAIDFSTAILKLKDRKVDVLVHSGHVNDTILFWRQSKSQGLNLKAVIGTGAAYSEVDTWKALGKDFEGALNAVPTTSECINKNALSPDTQKLLEEFKDYLKTKGWEDSSNTEWAFTGTWFLLKGVLPAAGYPLNPDAIRKAAFQVEIPNEQSITGYGYKLVGEGQPHPQQNARAFVVIQQWQAGKLETVYPENVATAKPIMIPLLPWDKRK